MAELERGLGMLLGLGALAPGGSADGDAREGGLRILLAEDHPVNQRLMLNLLEHAGHRVALARNGQEAVDLAADQPFDLILMDMQMPVLGGAEATARIREGERLAGGHVPIVALSAAFLAEDRQRGMEAGMDGYLTKPVKPKEMLELLTRISLGSRRRHAPAGAPGAPVAAVDAMAEAGERMARREEGAAVPATPFDYRAALERADRDVVDIIGQVFLEQSVADMGLMQAALAAGDWPTLARTAHSLKGSVANFCAEPVVALAGELERRAGQETADSALVSLVSRLAEELARFQAVLQEHLA